MADVYAQAVSMMADWIPFLAETGAALQTKMEKQGGGGEPAAQQPSVDTVTVPVPLAAPSTTPDKAEQPGWDDDDFDDWAEAMSSEDPGDSEPAAAEADRPDGEAELSWPDDDNEAESEWPDNLDFDSGLELEPDEEEEVVGPPTEPDDDWWKGEEPAPLLVEDEAETDPLPETKEEQAADDDEEDWFAAIKQ